MNGKLTLSFSVATFIAALAAMYFLSEVRTRLARVEARTRAGASDAVDRKATHRGAQDAGSTSALEGSPEHADASEKGGEEGSEDEHPVPPLDTKDPIVKLDWLVNKLDETDNRVYEGIVDLEGELYQLQRKVDKQQVMLRRLLDGLRASGKFEGLASSLPEPRKPLTLEQKKLYKDEAAKFGIRVEDGKVTARALLNGEQDKAYPIEYFMTRFPDAGHETLVHLIGNARLEDFAEPPFPSLDGLPTALYKALLAAGFEQGEGTHPVKQPDKPGEPVEWVLATGDTVYMYVRWKEDGVEKYARATDWVIDPATKSVLPEDCFRFTGSRRVESTTTGDELLLAEARGFLVSVYPDPAAMIEVALESAARNNYQYNWSRLPKHKEGEPFYMDVIFTRKPMDKQALASGSPKNDEPQKDPAKKGDDK